MCKKSPYSFIGQVYRTNKQITLDVNCNGITVINKGDSTLTFNGIPLLPSQTAGQTGETLSIGGNAGEILNSRIDVSFSAGGTNNFCVIVQKFYTCNG